MMMFSFSFYGKTNAYVSLFGMFRVLAGLFGRKNNIAKISNGINK